MDLTIMKRCIVGVRQPDRSPQKGSEMPSYLVSIPGIAGCWLSDDNRRLLRLIHDRHPSP